MEVIPSHGIESLETTLHIECPAHDSKLASATNSPVTSCGSLGDLDDDRWFTCNICLVSCDVEDNLIDKVCSNACPATVCSSCMLDYVICRTGDYLPGVLSKLPCPTCLIPVNMTRWKKKLGSMLPKYDQVFDQLDQKIMGSTELKCPWCHTNKIQLPPLQETVPTIKMFPAMASKIPELRSMCRAFCHHQLSATELIEYVQATFGTPLDGVILENMLPLIHDTERRATLYIRLRRMNPFIHTRCCNAPVCFSCHVEGHHEGKSCTDHSSKYSTDIVECGQCGLQLVKGDGCDSVQCYCGYQFQWLTALLEAKMRQLTTRHLDAFRVMVQKLRDNVYRHRMFGLVLSRIPEAFLARRKIAFEKIMTEKPHAVLRLRHFTCHWVQRIRKRQAFAELMEVIVVKQAKQFWIHHWEVHADEKHELELEANEYFSIGLDF